MSHAASSARLSSAHDANDTVSLTHTGDFLGTLRYAAPELLTGPGDARADIYGLGVTLWHDRLICEIALRDAEAVILYDPSFPARPFAP